MATPPPPARPAAPGGGASPASPNRAKWLIGALVAAIVAIAAIVAVTVSGDDDQQVAPSTPPATETPAAATGTAATGTAATGTAATGTGAAGAGTAASGSATSGTAGAPNAARRSPAEVQPVTVVGTPLVQGDGASDPGVGATAPVLYGYGLDGQPITIDAADGPVMVVFLAHWCPHCNREVPVLRQWFDSGAVPANLRVIGVSTAVRSGQDHYPPSQWIQQVSWPWPAMADSQNSDAAAAFGVTGFPYFAIIGQDGTVKVRNSGELPISELALMVNRALNS